VDDPYGQGGNIEGEVFHHGWRQSFYVSHA